MKYKEYIQLINTYAQMHRGAINAIADDYKKKNEKLAAKIAVGDLSQQGIEKLKAAEAPKKDEYASAVQSIQNKTRAAIEPVERDIKSEIDSYFSRPVNQEFSSKITAMAVSGMKPTAAEFELLEQEASSYTELRLLQTLAGDQYRIDVPNIDNVYNGFRAFKNSVNALINYYSGPNGELAEFMPQAFEGDTGMEGRRSNDIVNAYTDKGDKNIENS